MRRDGYAQIWFWLAIAAILVSLASAVYAADTSAKSCSQAVPTASSPRGLM